MLGVRVRPRSRPLLFSHRRLLASSAGNEPPETIQKTIDVSLEKLKERLSNGHKKLNHQHKRLKRESPKQKRLRGKSENESHGNSGSGSSTTYGLSSPSDYQYAYDSIKTATVIQGTIRPDSTYTPIDIPGQDPIPQLQHSLSRVLFSPGVHYLQDPRTKVFNFDPYLKHILPVEDFDFKSITTFVSASKDETLSSIAKDHSLKYYASTSSMTGVLSHMHYLFSNFRPASLIDLSRHHPERHGSPTKGAKLPAAVIVRKNANGCYSIDSDKSTDREMVLSSLGHSLERFLTKSKDEYEQYKKTNETKTLIEGNTYHYAKLDDFLMRSQLDCYDPRLPGTGTFDLKTRAVAGVRHDLAHVEKFQTGYELVRSVGRYESYEREMLELARSTMLKYSLQARIGNMDGIFVAYHNIVKMFGFEYLPLEKMDEILHSFGGGKQRPLTMKTLEAEPELLNYEETRQKLASKQADQEFKMSVKLWNRLLNEIIEFYIPNDSFRLVVAADPMSQFETKLRVVATRISSDEIEDVQKSGERLTKLLIAAVADEHQDVVKNHIKSIEKLNESVRHSPIGFEVYVKNYFDDHPSSQRHPQLKSDKTDWSVGVKVTRMDREDAIEFYNDCLNQKLDMLQQSSNIRDDEDVGAFVGVLRAFGDRRIDLRSDDEDVVWNKE